MRKRSEVGGGPDETEVEEEGGGRNSDKESKHFHFTVQTTRQYLPHHVTIEYTRQDKTGKM